MDSLQDSKVSAFKIAGGAKLQALSGLEEALTAYRNGACIWLDFTEPSREDLEELIEPLGIHRLSVEDCFDDEQVPKVENYSTNTFILFNRYCYVGGEFSISEVDLFLGDHFLVTVGLHQQGDSRCYERLENIMNADFKSVHKSADFLLHVVLDFIVDEKLLIIEALQEEIDGVEEEILNEPVSFNPSILMHLRRHLLNLRKSLLHEREILVKICRQDSPYISEKAIYHFRDIYDHLARFCEVTEMYREMVSNLMEIYYSIQNNRMTQAANRTNMVVRRLTLITTIFMPLSLLAGIGGMSEWSMMTGPDNWRVSYPVLIILMLIIAGLSYWILRALERRDT